MRKFIFILVGMLFTTVANATDVTLQGAWLHTSSSAYGDSPGVLVRLESPVFGDFSVGGEFGYHGPQEHSPYGAISGYHVLGEAIYNLHKILNIEPYILGAWGWSWWNWDRSGDMEEKGIEINVKDSFAQKYAVGGYYRLSDNWSINVEWNYFVSHVPKDSFYTSDGSFANVAGNDDRSGRIRIGQEETSLMVGVRYSF